MRAIYSNGILKPLGPVDLKEEELVDLTISPVVEDTGDYALSEDLSYSPMPPRTTSQVLMRFVHRGKGLPLPYDDEALSNSGES